MLTAYDILAVARKDIIVKSNTKRNPQGLDTLGVSFRLIVAVVSV